MPTQTTTLYRVIAITTNDFGAYNNGSNSQVTESVMWEGHDIVELSTLYPPSEIMFADPLGHAEIEDGLIRTGYRFEELRGGEWVTIDDPRVRQQVGMTDLELAVDEENRRLYPGDFEDKYCDACDNDFRDCICLQ